VEFNPWYPYTDKYIHEDVFKANVDRCMELGVEVCTLDAGWFGPSEQQSEWYYTRGDWNKINLARFPSGIKALADYVHSKGMKFGIWCEIEAAGPKAELNDIHPELIARRDGGHLGYVCLGNPDAVLWAFSVLEVLIADYGADWLKIEFNISPGAGCNRTDHGHGNGDGLYEHYHGYYKLLDMVREKYPHVLLENCSGGGLRIDLGIMKHMHLSFLSDPDYPPHAFQVFWGAAAMLHPSACLHWAWSQTTSDHKKNGVNNPITNDMPQYKFDYIIRNALLKNPGFSHKFNEYPQWCFDRLAHHFKFYKDVLRDFIRQSDCIRLTEQTLRSGDGDKWSSFLYVAEDKRRAVVFVFRLPGAVPERQLKLKGLDLKLNYRLDFQDKETSYMKTSFELMNDGILIAGMEEESSEVILLRQTDALIFETRR
jgi:alpha-galactosidase